MTARIIARNERGVPSPGARGHQSRIFRRGAAGRLNCPGAAALRALSTSQRRFARTLGVSTGRQVRSHGVATELSPVGAVIAAWRRFREKIEWDGVERGGGFLFVFGGILQCLYFVLG